MKTGAQLYTLHDYTKTLEGIEECFKKVSDMGYITVQVSDTCKYEAEMGFTLDVYWAKAGRHDPVEWLNKLKGRTPCVHYKDLITDADVKFKYAPVGEGELYFDAIIETILNKRQYFYTKKAIQPLWQYRFSIYYN